MKKLIDDWLCCKDVERVEMITQTDFVQANRLAELLGFKKEGTLKKYYNGIDFNIWGRIN
jgi:RimJ/RimL family protein N-acetyltransferase